MRIALLSHSGIGNIIMTTPCLRALRTQYPTAQIDLLTWPRSSQILKGWTVVNRVLEVHPLKYFEDNGPIDHVLFSPTGALWNAEWDDHTIVVTHVREMHRLSPKLPWDRHEVEYLMDFARKLGYEGETPSLDISILKQNHLNAQKILNQFKL